MDMQDTEEIEDEEEKIGVFLPEVSVRKTGQDSDKRKSAANFMILVVGLSICSFCSDEGNRGGHGRKVPIAVGSPRGSAATRDRDPDQGCVWRRPSAGAPVEAAELRSAGEEEEEEGGG